MAFNKDYSWAHKKGYFHHSQPTTPDYWVFFDKGILRPARKKALAILAGEEPGDVEQAKALLDKHGYYQDATGRTQYNDNINMISGRVVQNYCDRVLLEEISPGDSYAEAVNELQSIHVGSWRDQDLVKMQVEGRLAPRFTADGSKAKKDASFCELELVCQNALEGIREATKGANKIVGETELRGWLPGCDLPYLGFADYQEGGLELKTQWDSNVHTDSPRANSLPSQIKAPHMLQLAGYWNVCGKIPKIVYANRLGHRIFEPTEEELRYALDDIIRACKRRERLLRITASTEELLSLIEPNFGESFVWRDLHKDVITEAKKLSGTIE